MPKSSKPKRRIISTTVALALASLGGLSAEGVEHIEQEELTERHAMAKAPDKLQYAIALAEGATGASVLSVDFVNEAQTMHYQLQLLAMDGTRLSAEVRLDRGTIEISEC